MVMGAGSDLKQETQPSKKRKVVEKTVVRVRIGAKASGGKLKNEGLPSDFWSWRKYGQKPIKGSPYPRGYYRCSTAKGCSAKKQVEICRTDATMLIITYTSTHNHPGGPEPIHTSDQTGLQNPKQEGLVHEDPEEEEEEEEGKKLQENQSSPTTMNMSSEEDDKFHYLKSPIRCSQEGMEEEDPFSAHLLGGEPISCSHHELLMATTTTTSTTAADHFEGSDLFDELEELMPISPSSSLSYTSFVKMSSISFDERIPVVPFLN